MHQVVAGLVGELVVSQGDLDVGDLWWEESPRGGGGVLSRVPSKVLFVLVVSLEGWVSMQRSPYRPMYNPSSKTQNHTPSAQSSPACL
jgi:hypothetical protein